jgi:hypothetical protein
VGEEFAGPAGGGDTKLGVNVKQQGEVLIVTVGSKRGRLVRSVTTSAHDPLLLAR